MQSNPSPDQHTNHQKHRLSLQPQSDPDPLGGSSPLRTSRSQNFERKKSSSSKRTKPKSTLFQLPIVEIADGDDKTTTSRHHVDAKNDNVKVSISHENEHRASKASKSSRKTSTREPHSYDNAAYEGGPEAATTTTTGSLSRSNSASNSVRSSNRDPSLQSLTVIREQYCCCSRWSSLERTLFAAIGVLIFIIIALVIAVVLLAQTGTQKEASPSELVASD